MVYYSTKDCIACRRCVEVCAAGAPYINGAGFSIDPGKCVVCGSCAKVCTGGAIFPEGCVPPETLKQTVLRYNQLCRQGCDTDFGKFPRYLLALDTPPYYAFKCFLGSDGVFGGLRIDSECRVMGTGGPVAGLYAAGDITSSNYIKEHSHRVEAINDFTWANASGFLASETIEADLRANP